MPSQRYIQVNKDARVYGGNFCMKDARSHTFIPYHIHWHGRRIIARLAPAVIILISVALLGCQAFSDSTRSSESEEDIIVAAPDNPKISPSGKYQLQITEGFNGQIHYERFSVAKVRGNGLKPKVTYDSRDIFRTSDALYFLWGDGDRIWVFSGDLGTFYWTRESDDFWVKHYYGDENIPAPESLKKTEPEYFKK